LSLESKTSVASFLFKQVSFLLLSFLSNRVRNNANFSQSRKLKVWQRKWFVLKNNGGLFAFRAAEDIVPVSSTPLVGFTLVECVGDEKDKDKEFVFRLEHPSQKPLLFAAESIEIYEKFVCAMLMFSLLFIACVYVLGGSISCNLPCKRKCHRRSQPTKKPPPQRPTPWTKSTRPSRKWTHPMMTTMMRRRCRTTQSITMTTGRMAGSMLTTMPARHLRRIFEIF
jgi:hypothetical protein